MISTILSNNYSTQVCLKAVAHLCPLVEPAPCPALPQYLALAAHHPCRVVSLLRFLFTDILNNYVAAPGSNEVTTEFKREKKRLSGRNLWQKARR